MIINPDNKLVEQLLESIERDKARSIEQMPTEQDALQVMFRAFDRLRALGWKEAIYCPKDGTVFDAIEPGSSGIHDCVYHGEWPKGSWWVLAEGDMWPSRPCLFRLKASSEEPTPDDGLSSCPHSEPLPEPSLSALSEVKGEKDTRGSDSESRPSRATDGGAGLEGGE